MEDNVLYPYESRAFKCDATLDFAGLLCAGTPQKLVQTLALAGCFDATVQAVFRQGARLRVPPPSGEFIHGGKGSGRRVELGHFMDLTQIYKEKMETDVYG